MFDEKWFICYESLMFGLSIVETFLHLIRIAPLNKLLHTLSILSLIRLLSLFEYMLEDSGSAENKEILLFSHDKLLLASILRPLHQVIQGQSRTIKEAMFIRVQDPPQLQHWQIPTATHLGPTSAIFASIPTQANLRTYQPTQQLPPCWYPPLHLLSAVHLCRGDTIFFSQLFLLVSIRVHPPYTPLSLSTCRPTAVPSW